MLFLFCVFFFLFFFCSFFKHSLSVIVSVCKCGSVSFFFSYDGGNGNESEKYEINIWKEWIQRNNLKIENKTWSVFKMIWHSWYPIIHKGCPKIHASFELCAICAVKCWQFWIVKNCALHKRTRSNILHIMKVWQQQFATN